MTTEAQIIPASIKLGERRALAYFFLLLFLVGMGLAIGRGVTNALFIKRFGIGNLPWIFLAQGVGLVISGLLYLSLADRVRPERFLSATLGLMVTLLAIFWSVAQTTLAPWAYPPLYLFRELLSEILILHFSHYITLYFDAEQVKHLMPRAMAGNQIGELAGGLLLTLAVSVTGVSGMLLVWLASAAIAWWLVHFWHARHGPTVRSVGMARGGRPWTQAVRQLRQGVGFVRSSNLLRHSLLVLFFSVICLMLLSYLIKNVFQRTFSHEEELAAVFGLTTFIGGGISFLLQLAFSGKLIQRFGVRTMSLVFPASTLLAMVLFMTPWYLLAAIIGELNRRVMLPAIRNPVRGVQWRALPDYMQGRIRGLSLGIAAPLAIGVASLLLLLLRPWPVLIAVIGVIFALLVWHFSRSANRSYMAAIVDTLKERLFVPSDHLGAMQTQARSDNDFFAQLSVGLATDDEAMAESFAHMLVEHFGSAALPVILERMTRASIASRDRLTRLIAPHVTADNAGELLSRMGNNDAHGRTTILGVVFRARWPIGIEYVMECMRSDNPRLAACGAAGGLSYGDQSFRAEAEAVLNRMFSAVDFRERLAVLEMMVEQPHPMFRSMVLDALADPHPRIQLHAVRALRALDQPIVEDVAVRQLANCYRASRDRVLRAAVVQTSVLLPMAFRIDALLVALDDPQSQVQKLAIDILSAQPAAEVVGPLLDALRQWRLGVRGQGAALVVLSTMQPASKLREIGLDYLERMRRHRDWLAILGRAAEGGELLDILLRERVVQLADLGLRALAFGPDRAVIELMRAAMISGDQRQRMRCLDLLEDLADSEVRQCLRLMLHAEEAVPADPIPAREVLSQLVSVSDDWLANVARQWRPA